MEQLGKVLALLGLVLVALGGLLWVLGRADFKGLPGDIRYESDSVRFYFPIVSCILLSLLVSVGLWLWQWISRR
jgi:hypothetical protein